MEFTSSSKRERVLGIFQQIEIAIGQLKVWNTDVDTVEQYQQDLDPLLEAV